MAGDDVQAKGDWGTHLSADLLFELLADENRRTILRTLLHHEGPMEIEELVTESMAPVERNSFDPDAARSRLMKRFHHVHLPKLSDAEVIEYRDQRGLVRPEPVIEAFQPFLKLVEPFE